MTTEILDRSDGNPEPLGGDDIERSGPRCVVGGQCHENAAGRGIDCVGWAGNGLGRRYSGFCSSCTHTTMSNSHLPPEMLDRIIDLLHDEPEALKQCCLVSKSWVPRTRNNLFAEIKFRLPSELESWKKTFPDVANSPACQAHTLSVGCPWLVTASDAEEGGWIRAFSGISSLHVGRADWPLKASNVSLTPFYKLSRSLKSLRMGLISLPHPQIFDLVCSFPLLEDFTLIGYDEPLGQGDSPGRPQAVIPSSSPALTGTLGFHVLGGAESTLRQLLELPNGLHFRKLELSWARRESLWWITELVATCSQTLESLDVSRTLRRMCIRI